jgi:hypothetical protein
MERMALVISLTKMKVERMKKMEEMKTGSKRRFSEKNHLAMEA